MADQVTFNALRALDADGNPVSGAKAYFYETGTTTPVTVYTDTALSAAAASPLVADANGYFDQVFYNGAVSLKVVVDDADDVELFTLDPVATAATASAAASSITFTPTAEIAQSNVQDAIEQVQSNVDDAKTGADDGIVSGTAGTENHLVKWNGDGDAVDHGVAPTAGRILYGNGTNWVALDIGTADQVLKVNSGATAPEWGAAGWDFEATETNTGNGSYTVAHGLGVVPSIIAVSAVCKQATGNVTVGAEIPISGVAGYGRDSVPDAGTSSTFHFGMSVWADDTNIYFHYISNTGTYGDFYDGSTAHTFNQNSNADFDFKFRARVS